MWWSICGLADLGEWMFVLTINLNNTCNGLRVNGWDCSICVIIEGRLWCDRLLNLRDCLCYRFGVAVYPQRNVNSVKNHSLFLLPLFEGIQFFMELCNTAVYHKRYRR